MFQKKTEKQRKPKKLRVYTVNSRKPAVIVLWLMFICGFTFAVYKNFTAIDTHTVHEKEIVEWRVEDTSGVEAFVRNFAKTYYSWSGNKDSVAQRTDALTGYLTEDLQRLTADNNQRQCKVEQRIHMQIQRSGIYCSLRLGGGDELYQPGRNGVGNHQHHSAPNPQQHNGLLIAGPHSLQLAGA